MTRALPLGLLLAASSLSAQVVISGAGGLANETYSTAISTNGGTTLSLAFMVDYLVVGGGGAGGTAGGSGGENTWGAGGGGAGGVLAGSTNLTSTTYTVTVGAGGVAAGYSAGSTTNGGSGTKSVFGSIEALGGGGGAGSNNAANGGGVGLSGGSGGGGGGDGLKAGGAGTLGQGFGGGTSRSSAGNRAAGGGGGGAGGVGEIGGPPNGHNSGVGGDGGVGVSSSISGSSVFYGGGGGGGGRDTNGGATSAGGTGGSGGGGAGSGQGNATSGTNGFGGGGGGSGADGQGGNGGHGAVIVRYKGEAAATGGTIASGTGTSAGHTLHTFSTVGNSTLDLSSVDLDTRLGSVVSSSISGTGALTVSTKGTIVYTGTATHSGGTNVIDGVFILGNGGTGGSLEDVVSVASGASLEYNRSGDATFSSLSGSGSVVKKGTGALNLSGFGTFNGTIIHEAGAIRVIGNDALGSAAITLAGGALSSNSNFARTVSNTVKVSANTTLGNATRNGELTLSGGVDLNGGTRVLTVASDVVISGAISNGNLTKVGSGALTLSGDNSAYSGDITLGVLSGGAGGALRIGSVNALGTGTIILRNVGGSIASDGATARTIANAIVFADTGYDLTLGDATRRGALTLSGDIDLGARGSTLTVLSDVTHTGTLSNPALAFTKDGAGTLTLSGDNSGFAPGFWFNINAGKVRIGSATALGTSRLSLRDSALTSVGSTARVINQEAYFFGDMTLGDTTDNGALIFADNISFASGTRTLTTVVDVSILGSIRDGNLVKGGAGTLTLSGVSLALTPSITVNEGTLVVDGALGANGTVGVASGATLGGSGTIAGATVISGIHAPGNSPGLQTFGTSLTYQAGAEIQWELAGHTDAAADRGAVFDGIDVAGDLTFSGSTLLTLAFALAGSGVDWADPFWSANHSWKLLDVGGSVFGFENLTLGDTSALLDSQGETFGASLDGAQFALAYRSGDIYVDYTAAIPEPSTYGLILGALALAGAAVRRRKARQA